MTKIRVTFYTASDDFPSEFTIDHAREWVRSRVSGPSVIQTPLGSVSGRTVDQLDDSELAKWLAAIALQEIRAGDALNVRERAGKWVSIHPERVEAVGAEVVDLDDEDAGADDQTLLPFELDQPWQH